VAQLYLAFNALMYAALAVWCAADPQQTMEFVGLSAANAGGESEYLAVFGGLQAGLALYYGLAVISGAHQRSVLWMSVFLYGGLAGFRSLSVVQLGFQELGNARLFYGAEIVLFLAALYLVSRRER
jgi:hypothetical protein